MDWEPAPAKREERGKKKMRRTYDILGNRSLYSRVDRMQGVLNTISDDIQDDSSEILRGHIRMNFLWATEVLTGTFPAIIDTVLDDRKEKLDLPGVLLRVPKLLPTLTAKELHDFVKYHPHDRIQHGPYEYAFTAHIPMSRMEDVIRLVNAAFNGAMIAVWSGMFVHEDTWAPLKTFSQILLQQRGLSKTALKLAAEQRDMVSAIQAMSRIASRHFVGRGAAQPLS